MSENYQYNDIKPRLFTDEGQRLFLAIRDRTNDLLKQAGAARCHEMISGSLGELWDMLACVDRMIELKEIREVTTGEVMWQHRVFVSDLPD